MKYIYLSVLLALLAVTNLEVKAATTIEDAQRTGPVTGTTLPDADAPPAGAPTAQVGVMGWMWNAVSNTVAAAANSVANAAGAVGRAFAGGSKGAAHEAAHPGALDGAFDAAKVPHGLRPAPKE